MTIVRRIFVLASLAMLLGAPLAQAQTTGSITGVVTDASGAVLPGATITLSGERLIGGPQTQVSDTSGTYRFDRLVPGNYNVKFELQGFRNVERPDVRISAAFVATINAKMEVGSVSETITVTGESPTVDVRSNVQQTVMNQEILEGIPTGRDPWSLAKLIPGVQVATYDVGGTQSMQQSSMSAHGSSTNDVSYNIDGATVNWPGGGGGATMIYYDQGMFEEVNYMTSAIPAEMLAGGVSINMVTKDGGNQWKGNAPLQLRERRLQGDNCSDTKSARADVPRQPDQQDLRLQLLRRRRARPEQGVGQRHHPQVGRQQVRQRDQRRRQPGARRQRPEELLGQGGRTQLTTNNKLIGSYFWNNKIRGHRRDSNDIIPDIASRRADQPGADDAGQVHRHPRQPGVRVELQHHGRPDQLHVPAGHSIRRGSHHRHRHRRGLQRVDRGRASAELASSVRQHVHVRQERLRRRAPAQGRRAVGPAVLLSRTIRCWTITGWTTTTGVPVSVRMFNTPVVSENVARVMGFFVQDSSGR